MPIRYRGTLAAIALAALASLAARHAAAGVISPELAAQIAQHAPSDKLPVIIQLPDRVDLSAFRVTDRRKRNNGVLVALKAKSAASLAALAPLFNQLGIANPQQLWIINAVTATLPIAVLQELARSPLVGQIGYDSVVLLQQGPKAAATAPSGSWNLDAVNAPVLWSAGSNGAGTVVASLDTGVDNLHPDLAAGWRGGTNSWYDPYGQHAQPYDASGHGTQTMGLMAGGAGSGAPIGMAPGARWIAARAFDDSGAGTLSKIHVAFQWLLDPDGNAATLDAPDVVNASWALSGLAPGSCNLEFAQDIAALRAAGIAVVFAAGNAGPDPGTSVSPAANPGAVATGSVDAAMTLAPSSSRGPSACDGSVYPRLVAPGVDVVSSDLSFGGMPLYATVSGTSFAAPHVSGAMALLASAYPAAPMSMIESALVDGARDLGDAGPDNQYGHGVIDVAAARDLLATRAGGHAPVISSTAPASATVGKPYSYAVVASDVDGGPLAYSLLKAPAGMTIDAASGVVGWVPALSQAGTNGAVVQVADPTGLVATQGFSVNVAKPNSPPVAAADSYTVSAGTTLSVAAPGVLANDRDPDGDPMTAVLASGVAHGTLALDASGALRYTPAAGYSGSDSFTYRAADASSSSAAVNVAITVQASQAKAPLALADSYAAPAWRSGSYAARSLTVLDNDNPNGGTLVVSSVEIVSAPNHGGSAKPGATGAIAYTPAMRFTGTESFSYRVRNSAGLWSNTATVSVKVQ